MALEPNDVLDNRYRIKSVLAKGGMGAVYKAEDTRLGVVVAVKENLFTNAKHARQFRREATLLATIHHRHLPRVTDHFVIEGQGQYLAMDFIPGEDTRTLLTLQGPLPVERVVRWGLQICSAVVYLHGLNPPVFHRDIKPGNIKITPDGEAYLVDFGLAKIQKGSSVTTTGVRGMTQGFSPPEQYGIARTDARTDIYALGATFYNLLTAVVPEDGLARAMGTRKLTPLLQHNPDVSRSVARAIERAMAVRMEDRYQTVTEFSRALWEGSVETMGTHPLPGPAVPGPLAHVQPVPITRPATTIHGHFEIVGTGIPILIPPGKTSVVIGRTDPDRQFSPEVDLAPHITSEDGVSRQHVKLLLMGGQLYVEDLHSTNFAFLNNERLEPEQRYPLNAGDELRLGRLRLTYHDQEMNK